MKYISIIPIENIYSGLCSLRDGLNICLSQFSESQVLTEMETTVLSRLHRARDNVDCAVNAMAEIHGHMWMEGQKGNQDED